MNLITEFGGSDENVVPIQKPKYVRQLAMVESDAGSCMPDPVKPELNKTNKD